MTDMTFLSEEELWGDSALEVIKDYGRPTALTDLAILLGGIMDDSVYKTAEDDLSGYIWSASPASAFYVRSVYCHGVKGYSDPRGRDVAARPALPSSETSTIRPNVERALRLKNGNTVKIAEWGEYPQAIASEAVSKALEAGFKNAGLSQTGKKYTFDSNAFNSYYTGFTPRECPEYELNGKKYIRIEAMPRDSDSVLSNGHKIEKNEVCWVEVQPIEWLVDEAGKWVAKKALFAGVQFDTESEYKGDFGKTHIKSYMDTYFSKEIQQERTAAKGKEKTAASLLAAKKRGSSR